MAVYYQNVEFYPCFIHDAHAVNACFEKNEWLKFQLESASAAVVEHVLNEKEMRKIIEGFKMKVALLEGELSRRPSNEQHVKEILERTKLEKEMEMIRKEKKVKESKLEKELNQKTVEVKSFMEVAKSANELVENLKTKHKKLRLNFESMSSRNNELERNAKEMKALLEEAQEDLKESKLESESNYEKFILEREESVLTMLENDSTLQETQNQVDILKKEAKSAQKTISNLKKSNNIILNELNYMKEERKFLNKTAGDLIAPLKLHNLRVKNERIKNKRKIEQLVFERFYVT